MLPDFLQPSIPTKSNAPWKNKEQRAADRAAREAHAQGLPPPMPEPEVRWVRVPLEGEALPQLPAVLPPGEHDRQPCGLEEYGAGVPEPRGGLGGLGSPPKRKQGAWGSGGAANKKQRPRDGEDGEEGGLGRGAGMPHSQEARDAKSGKGRKRLFLHPIIRTRDRCGKCPVSAAPLRGLVAAAADASGNNRGGPDPTVLVQCCTGACLPRLPCLPDCFRCSLRPALPSQACLNLHWKKACMTRRAEQEGSGL